MPAASADQIAIRDLLRAMNLAWRQGRVEQMREGFHPDAVIVAPGFRTRAESREACLKSYQDFIDSTRVTQYQESDVTIDVWGDTAVATYEYEIAWDVNNQPFRDSGRDVFVLRREAGRWWVLWRTLLPHR
jgi:ketosteroid isomerase-like protein